LPHISKLAQHGAAVVDIDAHLAEGLNVQAGQVVNETVAQSLTQQR